MFSMPVITDCNVRLVWLWFGRMWVMIIFGVLLLLNHGCGFTGFSDDDEGTKPEQIVPSGSAEVNSDFEPSDFASISASNLSGSGQLANLSKNKEARLVLVDPSGSRHAVRMINGKVGELSYDGVRNIVINDGRGSLPPEVGVISKPEPVKVKVGDASLAVGYDYSVAPLMDYARSPTTLIMGLMATDPPALINELSYLVEVELKLLVRESEGYERREILYRGSGAISMQPNEGNFFGTKNPIVLQDATGLSPNHLVALSGLIFHDDGLIGFSDHNGLRVWPVNGGREQAYAYTVSVPYARLFGSGWQDIGVSFRGIKAPLAGEKLSNLSEISAVFWGHRDD